MPEPAVPSIPDDLVAAVRSARRVVVLTGAGVSAESGVPTFRDAMDGLWAQFDPQDLATEDAFFRNPEHVTRWYDERRVRCLSVQPNPAHRALVDYAARLKKARGRLTLITQNVDRLHQAAGSRNVIELHGNLFTWRCIECGVEREELGGPFASFPPHCACDGWMRPGVVWFGESLPAGALKKSYRLLEGCDLFFSIGTSAVVQPAAGFVHHVPDTAGTVEINRERTAVTAAVRWSLMGPAGELLPLLISRAFSA